MTTNLEHADRILAAKPKTWLMVAESVKVLDMHRGGMIALKPGDKLRISCVAGAVVFGDTTNAEHVSFMADDALCFEIHA